MGLTIRQAEPGDAALVLFFIVKLAEYEKLESEVVGTESEVREALFGPLRRCVADGLPRLQWWVLNWNAPSIEFYKSIGAEAQDEWTVFRVSGAALERLAQ